MKLLLALLLVAMPAMADIYYCRDANGKPEARDTPCASTSTTKRVIRAPKPDPSLIVCKGAEWADMPMTPEQCAQTLQRDAERRQDNRMSDAVARGISRARMLP